MIYVCSTESPASKNKWHAVNFLEYIALWTVLSIETSYHLTVSSNALFNSFLVLKCKLFVKDVNHLS
jgi:hypothetical protein